MIVFRLTNSLNMVQLDQFQRAVAIGYLDKGYKPTHIAKDLGVSPSSITRLKDKVAKLGKDRSLKNARGQGRKDKASLRDVMIWSKVMFSDESTFWLIWGTKKTVRRRFVRVRGALVSRK